MKACLIFCILSCCACSTLQGSSSQNDSVGIAQLPCEQESHLGQAVLAEESDSEGVLNPDRDISQLLIQRLDICNRFEAFDVSKFDLANPLVEGVVDEHRLDVLIYASCKPERTPGILNQLLVDLTSIGTWPEEYAAFFDMLIASQKAYATAEKLYLKVKDEHEKTIQGLTDIETQIEQQSNN